MSLVAAEPSSARFAIGAPLIVALLVAASVALHLVWPLQEDTSWLLTVGQRMLAGRTLYTDILELNPPMSAWLFLPWVWLAPKLGMSADVLTALGTIAVCLGSIALAARILVASRLFPDRAAFWIVASIALLVTPVLTFAQREHFAVAFALPMLAAVAARAAGRSVPTWALVVAGVCGGLAMAVKPHFALAILLPAFYAAAMRRSLWPLFGTECLAAGATFAAYLAAALALHPEYFSDMLPIAAAIYVPNRNPLDVVLTRPFAVLTYLCLVAWHLRAGFRATPFSNVLLAATIGFLAAYLVQGRGWTYHALPAATLATIGFGLSPFWKDADRAAKRTSTSVFASLASGLLALTAAANVIERERDELPFIRQTAETLRGLGADLKVAVLSDEIAVGSPLHRVAGARLVNSGPALWIAGNAYAFCATHPGDEARQACDRAIARERATLLDDLRRDPPDIVIADKKARDWLAWAREDPETAKILAAYRPRAIIDHANLKVEILARDGSASPNVPPLNSGPRP
ncbi:hypothetical protein [Methylopila sp. M107]|uniref:hypothetical protein n=1 Tax=Methylopila sp. M107 TaxID=1101190 RepID=UPI00036049B3|nr:hypothetical protein [Methylopila sp. M107]